MNKIFSLEQIASQIRRDIIRMVTMAASGHPGGSLGSTDFLTALFFKEMKHSPETWSRCGRGNDVFLLSAGHLSPIYYAVLARSGYFDVKELATFRKFGSRLQGHPSIDHNLPGVHIASGSLGQGLSVASGVALSKRMEKDNSFVHVLMGDGECEEGQIWEAAMFAAQYKLNKLIAIIDWNGQQIDGPVDSIISLGDLEAKWRSFGWEPIICCGHEMPAILEGFSKAKEFSANGNRPIVLLMKTDMGMGVDFMCGTHEWHGKAPSKEQEIKALSQLEETIGDF